MTALTTTDSVPFDRLMTETRRALYSARRCWWKPLWQLEVHGVENVPTAGAALLCANHTSHLDASAILAALPRDLALRSRTAAAKDVFGNRRGRILISQLLTGALPVERQSDFAGGLRALEEVLRDGRPLILFPEGRRSPNGELVEFKLGAAMLAVRTAAPIVPIRLEGLHKALPRGAYLPHATKVHVYFGKPLDPTPLREAIGSGDINRREAYQQLTHDLRSAIAAMTSAA